MARTGFAAPPTTSAGRLFDAVAALCGVRAVVRYEGQAAIELEAAADPAERGALRDGRRWTRARRSAAIAADVAAGAPAGVVSARFHRGLARATADGLRGRRRARGDSAWSCSAGGVFHNRLLLSGTVALLERAGLRVLTAERLPAGDGGIAFGQAAVAAATPV